MKELNKRYVAELSQAQSVLETGDSILYPTDTVWGIGCDATNENAVKKVYQIKNREESKSLIILVDSLEMLQSIIPIIPRVALDLIEKTTKPTSIIYKNPIGLAKNVIANDNTVAIRIVQDEFCQALIKKFGKPIVSTSANISNKPTPTSFSEISSAIRQQVDYIVPLNQEIIQNKSSKIVVIKNDDSIKVIRP